ncbi:MAG: hypothetical protein LBV69_04295 [Bacteroidales bacterium]|jgi:hypothetical protein|nr:hypothetical protein [Bacteroidales bacterium]
MKIFNKIFCVVLALLIFISANGFFFEKFLCCCTQTEKANIALFEFGEISNNTNCCESGCCSLLETTNAYDKSCFSFQKYSEIQFFSLTNLIHDFFKINIKSPISSNLVINNFGFIFDILRFNYLEHVTSKIHKPPLIFEKFLSGFDFCINLSIFRL